MENMEGITGRVGRENGNKILEPEKAETHKSVLDRDDDRRHGRNNRREGTDPKPV